MQGILPDLFQAEYLLPYHHRGYQPQRCEEKATKYFEGWKQGDVEANFSTPQKPASTQVDFVDKAVRCNPSSTSPTPLS